MGEVKPGCVVKTVKNAFPVIHRDFRQTIKGDCWTSEYGVISKIEPKVAWEDPKAKKHSIYVIKLFFRIVSHGAAMCHYVA